MTDLLIIGCGFVADYYLSTLKEYPQLRVDGLYDQHPEASARLAEAYGLKTYDSMKEALAGPSTIVLNLTNPRSHYEVSKTCLEAGKHVYSEKPLAMELGQAQELVDIARERGLQVISAPCSLLGEQAQTLWKAVKDEVAGKIWLVYAEMEDGPVHLMGPENWQSVSGAPWPVKDEFEVGCTLEHAGYVVPWFVAMFGSVTSITAHASVRIPEKVDHTKLDPSDTPDFTLAVLQFESGVEARLSCGIVAPHDHQVKLYGQKGILWLDECWHYGNPVKFHEYHTRAFKAEKYSWIRSNPLFSYILGLRSKTLPFVTPPDSRFRWKKDYMDYARGVQQLADAIDRDSDPILSPEFCLHVNEVVLAIQNAAGGAVYKPQTRAPQVYPLFA